MPSHGWIASVVVLVLVGCGSDAAKVRESVLATAGAGSSAAQPSRVNYDTFTVAGVGQNDCGQMTAALRADVDTPGFPRVMTGRMVVSAVYTHYATGFITGINYRSMETRQGVPNVSEGTSVEALFAATEQYCEQHPLDKVVFALGHVYSQLLFSAR